jgi:hypothetical protein
MVGGRQVKIVACGNGFAIVENELHSKAYLRADGFWDQFRGKYHQWPTREAAAAFLAQHADQPAAVSPAGPAAQGDRERIKIMAAGCAEALRIQQEINQRLTDWKHGVLCAARMIPEFETGTWAGEKDGWGFVFELIRWQTKEVAQLREQLEAAGKELSALRQLNIDHCADEDRIKALALPILGEKKVDGDSHHVPGSVELFEMLVEQLAAAQKHLLSIDMTPDDCKDIVRAVGIVCLANTCLMEERDAAKAEVAKLRLRLLSAAGDDLCRLTQEEIKAYTSGEVQIPPKEEFIASCERFHQQIAAGPGVLSGCLTLAQLIAENERLKEQLVEAERVRNNAHEYSASKCVELINLKADLASLKAAPAAPAATYPDPQTAEQGDELTALRQLNIDHCADEERIKALALPILGEKRVNGEGYFVNSLQVVEMLVEQLASLKAAKETS